jgi:hypothetical protein
MFALLFMKDCLNINRNTVLHIKINSCTKQFFSQQRISKRSVKSSQITIFNHGTPEANSLKVGSFATFSSVIPCTAVVCAGIGIVGLTNHVLLCFRLEKL